MEATYVLGPRPNRKKQTSIHEKKSIKVEVRQVETSIRIKASAGGTDREEGDSASVGVPVLENNLQRKSPLPPRHLGGRS